MIVLPLLRKLAENFAVSWTTDRQGRAQVYESEISVVQGLLATGLMARCQTHRFPRIPQQSTRHLLLRLQVVEGPSPSNPETLDVEIQLVDCQP